jgi:hypothetical protein
VNRDGPGKVISERLGHASVAFTLSTYGHVIPGMDKDAATTVADLIMGHEPTTFLLVSVGLVSNR